MEPNSQAASEVQDEREWELADEDLDRTCAQAWSAYSCYRS